LASSRPASTGPSPTTRICAPADASCPTTSRQAIDDFKDSKWIGEILGADVQGRYADLKQAAANRSPRELGHRQGSEVQFHHAVYNQSLWNLF
jgi:glutamine synthetase